MKRLLVLAYYFPPLGMSGVQRTLKFVKYLPENGWQPVVVTPDHRGSYGHDPALLAEAAPATIVRTRSLDPLFLSPPRNDPHAVNKHRGSINLVNFFFVPDNKIGWVPFAVAAGVRAGRRQRIDAVYSTAPPYSSHLAALLVATILGKPLVTDYRDAWSQRNPLNHLPTALHQRINRALERCVSRHSRLVMAINREIADGLRAADQPPDKFVVVPHGYDPQDFAGLPRPDRGQKFTLAYSGTFMGDRNPAVLAEAVSHLKRNQPQLYADLRVVIAGSHRPQDPGIVARLGISDVFDFRSYLPHQQSLALITQADALWLVIGAREGPTVSSSKLYEYLGAGRPVIASIPAGCAAARIIAQTKAGIILDPRDAQGLAAAIAALYQRRQQGRPLFKPEAAEVSAYDRRAITQRFARLLDSITPGTASAN
ncbi:MAG TPA: glycosyltransferase family 4 protein, partial [Candidatus Edwardsbacteria bacterium]|nr:glycosyltransferase family 4 protein [Candidatus Edwardsbacteria bacterium]